ncbi:hypothetical protein F4779DRAFT_622189 [Xylariaceae sp. FL0662B]|nr:hypothetical protein F4779DRAFT_622189 [Xylariaceae sp. FL0662B]
MPQKLEEQDDMSTIVNTPMAYANAVHGANVVFSSSNVDASVTHGRVQTGNGRAARIGSAREPCGPQPNCGQLLGCLWSAQAHHITPGFGGPHYHSTVRSSTAQDGLIHSMPFDNPYTSIDPKILGARNLRTALFSLWDAAANSFLDSLAHHRQHAGIAAASLVLPMVLGVGANLEQPLKRRGMDGVDEDLPLEAFEAAIVSQIIQGEIKAAYNGITRDGAFVEYCLVRAEVAVKPCETVAIQGLGGPGHLALQYARQMGYRVVAVSRSAEKEKAAREFGAREYIDASKGDVGEQLWALDSAKFAITTALDSNAFTPLINGLGITGKLLIVTGVPDPITVDATAMIMRGAQVQAWPVPTVLENDKALSYS